MSSSSRSTPPPITNSEPDYSPDTPPPAKRTRTNLKQATGTKTTTEPSGDSGSGTASSPELPSRPTKRQRSNEKQEKRPAAEMKPLPSPCKTCDKKEDVKFTVRGPGGCVLCNSCRVSWRSAKLRGYSEAVWLGLRIERMILGRPTSKLPYNGERQKPKPTPSPSRRYWHVKSRTDEVEEEAEEKAEEVEEPEEPQVIVELDESPVEVKAEESHKPQVVEEHDERQVTEDPDELGAPDVQADIKPTAAQLARATHPLPRRNMGTSRRAAGPSTGPVDTCPSTCEFARWHAGWTATMRLLPHMAAHPDKRARQELHDHLMQHWDSLRALPCSCSAALERPRLKLDVILEFSTAILAIPDPIPHLTDAFVFQMTQANDMIKTTFPIRST
ncbi:hypothetical protein CspHIS471_0609020 [Cutaneotrichosporon sp. HIS471]|nr:hypothetical protein CspHIS471_0609020 [Cutaneotrichosporon sp. HIS471]